MRAGARAEDPDVVGEPFFVLDSRAAVVVCACTSHVQRASAIWQLPRLPTPRAVSRVRPMVAGPAPVVGQVSRADPATGSQRELRAPGAWAGQNLRYPPAAGER